MITMVSDFLQDKTMVAVGINLIVHILCNNICPILENRSIWKHNIVQPCTKYGILVVGLFYLSVLIFYPNLKKLN